MVEGLVIDSRLQDFTDDVDFCPICVFFLSVECHYFLTFSYIEQGIKISLVFKLLSLSGYNGYFSFMAPFYVLCLVVFSFSICLVKYISGWRSFMIKMLQIYF